MAITLDPAFKKHVVIVTGCHRSGTSVTAYILQQLGIQLGDHLLKGPEFSNPDGHFEDLDLMQIHDRIMLENHMLWHNIVKCFTIDRFNKLDISLSNHRYWYILYRKIAKYNNIDTCFGYKDPRLSIMLDIICHKLRGDGYIPVVILCWRNCHDIAKSLIKRDHFTIEKAMNVATSYQFVLGSMMVPFLEHHNIDYLNVTFERLVTRPVHVVNEIASFIQSVIGLHIRPIIIQRAVDVVRVRPVT